MLSKLLKKQKKLKIEGLGAGWLAGWPASDLASQPASSQIFKFQFLSKFRISCLGFYYIFIVFAKQLSTPKEELKTLIPNRKLLRKPLDELKQLKFGGLGAGWLDWVCLSCGLYG